MNQYFFKMKKEEKENILDKHRHVYDGYVTTYGQNINNQPLYVQDFANDKEGITVSNKGVVKTYTNMNINENVLDTIADGPYDLKTGTVDFDSYPETTDYNTDLMHDIYPSPNEDEEDLIISIGDISDELPHTNKFSYGSYDDEDDFDYIDDNENEDIDYVTGSESFKEMPYNEFFDETEIENVDELQESINESLKMFKRFTKYN
jgi:hypothetical protein